ncbi:helix-turn-helix domain-containing protein [Solibacillus silvestris]
MSKNVQLTFTYLKDYSNFNSIEEMDKNVKLHVTENFFNLTESTRKILFAIAGRSLKYIGAAHLRAQTIATAVGVSRRTVMRAIKELEERKIIKRIKQTKKNGIKGANIYSILPFVTSNDTSGKSHRGNKEVPCGSKDEGHNSKDESLVSFSNEKFFKDIPVQRAETGDSSNPVIETEIQKPNLRTRISRQMKARKLSLSKLNEFATIAYSNINKILKVDSTIPREYLEDLAYRKLLGVFDDEGIDCVFSVFTYRLKKEFNKLIGKSGEQDSVELNAKRGAVVRPVPQFMIDNETDLIRKAKLIKNNEVAKAQKESLKTAKGKKVGVVPDWFYKQKEEQAQKEAERQAALKAKAENAPPIDYAAEKERLLKMLEM